MTTGRDSRRRFERRADRETRHSVTKRQERFIESLIDARDTLDSVIGKAEQGSESTWDTLAELDSQMASVFRQAERVESDND